ncbi:hypothetical protein GCM10022252_76300 [Streptosporangium oxazolinicum]|uniref:Uncharacterized protein n=1 Tax=Streptosporangium oxazolinicum TaxID=909287 RepID=A0ABP8BL42_9ACTN
MSAKENSGTPPREPWHPAPFYVTDSTGSVGVAGVRRHRQERRRVRREVQQARDARVLRRAAERILRARVECPSHPERPAGCSTSSCLACRDNAVLTHAARLAAGDHPEGPATAAPVPAGGPKPSPDRAAPAALTQEALTRALERLRAAPYQSRYADWEFYDLNRAARALAAPAGSAVTEQRKREVGEQLDAEARELWWRRMLFGNSLSDVSPTQEPAAPDTGPAEEPAERSLTEVIEQELERELKLEWNRQVYGNPEGDLSLANFTGLFSLAAEKPPLRGCLAAAVGQDGRNRADPREAETWMSRAPFEPSSPAGGWPGPLERSRPGWETKETPAPDDEDELDEDGGGSEPAHDHAARLPGGWSQVRNDTGRAERVFLAADVSRENDDVELFVYDGRDYTTWRRWQQGLSPAAIAREEFAKWTFDLSRDRFW